MPMSQPLAVTVVPVSVVCDALTTLAAVRPVAPAVTHVAVAPAVAWPIASAPPTPARIPAGRPSAARLTTPARHVTARPSWYQLRRGDAFIVAPYSLVSTPWSWSESTPRLPSGHSAFRTGVPAPPPGGRFVRRKPTKSWASRT